MNRIVWSVILFISLILSSVSFSGLTSSQVIQPEGPPRGDYLAGDNNWYERVKIPQGDASQNPRVDPQVDSADGDPDAWNKIVMMSYRNENWEIYLAASGSTGAPINRLTVYSRDDVNPSLNRGANTIVYASYREGYYNLFSMKADGSSQVRLTGHKANDDEPQWAPYGMEFAFVSDRDGNREIYKMIRDGNQQVRLTNHPNGDFSPVYSPDGMKIAWVRVVSSTQGQIMVMNLDGSNQHPLSPPIYYLTDLAWSPRGDAISFSYFPDLNWNFYVLGRYLIDTNEVKYLKGCGSYRDCRNGSYMSESQFIYSELKWEEYGNDWYITEMLMKKYIPDYSNTYSFSNSAWDFAPDAAPIDTVAPRVTPNPLPAFALSSGLTLGWWTYDDRPDSDPITFLQYQKNGSWYGIGGYSLPTNTYAFKGTAGETYAFRFYARDSAGNMSPIPKEGTRPVTFYDWAVNGSYTDVRGVPIPGVVHPEEAKCLNKGEAYASDPAGRLDCYLKESSNTFTPQKNGYGSLPSTTIIKNGTAVVDWVLPSGDDLLTNGSFEAAPSLQAADASVGGVSGWESSGVLAPVQTDTQWQYGTKAVMFGQANPVGEVEVVDGAQIFFGTPELVKDSAGVLHLAWSNNADLLYSHRPVGGSWSAPAVIYTGVAGETNRAVELAITPGDTLHVTWVSVTGIGYEAVQKIRYFSRPVGQPWTAPVDVVSGINIYNLDNGRKPLLAADGLGGLHVVWPDMGGVMIVHRPAGGAWSMPEQLAGLLCNAIDITATPDGSTWVLWQDIPGTSLQRRLPDGTWNPVEILWEGKPVYYVDIDIASNGRQHVVYSSHADLYFIERDNLSSPWSTPVIVDVNEGYVEHTNLVSGVNGELHLAFWQDWKIYYRTRYPDGSWSIGGLMPEQYWKFPPAMIPQADGSAQAVWGNTEDSFAYSILHLPKTSSGSFEQLIAIPAQAHQPTLSFFINLPASLTDRSFAVKVGGQNVFTTSAATSGWEKHWIDLTPWKGQQVKVQFSLTEGALDTQVYVFLDEVTAGSARTPTINAVGLDEDQVTITGTNFLEGVAVRIGGVLAAVVNRVDEHTLVMTLPEGLLPGWQDVWVLNPQGEEAWMKNGLLWKEVVHIPLVGKNNR